MTMKRKTKSTTGARRPPNPKASRSGFGFHSEGKYSKADRRGGKRLAGEE